jgi:hypothetical protein
MYISKSSIFVLWKKPSIEKPVVEVSFLFTVIYDGLICLKATKSSYEECRELFDPRVPLFLHIKIETGCQNLCKGEQ